jgi:hypothetical protein
MDVRASAQRTGGHFSWIVGRQIVPVVSTVRKGRFKTTSRVGVERLRGGLLDDRASSFTRAVVHV